MSSPYLLIVDDDEEIRTALADHLSQDDFNVHMAGTAHEARAVLRQGGIDLIVLDLTLPDGDGLALCNEVRSSHPDVEILVLSARASPNDRILGLELGADDYMTKPFAPRELSLRVRNMLRRQRRDTPRGIPRGARHARFAGWTLDLVQRHLVDEQGKLVSLSAAEYRLICKFIENPRDILGRDQLVPDWRAADTLDRSIDQQISRLRHKLGGRSGRGDIIITVRNEGYILATEVTFP